MRAVRIVRHHSADWAPIRRALAAGWLGIMILVAVDLLQAAHSRPATVGACAALVAASAMVASLANNDAAARAWFRRGVFVASTVMGARAIAAGLVLGWGFDARLSLALSIIAGALWIAARRLGDTLTTDSEEMTHD